MIPKELYNGARWKDNICDYMVPPFEKEIYGKN